MARDDHRDLHPSETASRADASRSTRSSARGGQLDLGDLAIDRGGEIPIGVQLAWALRARIGDGRLGPGQRLPGLRELAEMLGINANTARAVYQRLEQEGLIDSMQGTGTFVASVAPEPSAVGQIAADAAHQARRTGVDPREVAAALYVTTEPPAGAATEGSERRRELRTQITALEQALSEIQARHPGLIAAPSKPLRHAGPRLLSVEELEGVRTALVRRLAAAGPVLEKSAQDSSATAAARSHAGTPRHAEPASEAPESKSGKAGDGRKANEGRKATRPRPQTRPSTA
ncbi:MAG TPA: GntR family transcriptional regulator [Solirubrobacteraceae bacterium]|jgi:GntR family transcriptional regulator|nr:GntR family transcriptional regulator [Solirubrobacteraceae bacterium]